MKLSDQTQNAIFAYSAKPPLQFYKLLIAKRLHSNKNRHRTAWTDIYIMSNNQAEMTILGIDVASYSDQPLIDQKNAQEIVDRSIFDAYEKKWPSANIPPVWIDAGDGGYLLLSGHEMSVLELLQEIQSLVDYETRNWADGKGIYLRYAIHKDLVLQWNGKLGQKYTGNSINICARLLSGMIRTNFGQVVCSKQYASSIDSFGNNSVNIRRLRDISDKHGNQHSVFNLLRSPGFGIEPQKSELHDDPFSRR